MLKYAKVVTIRDIQKAEHKKMEEDYKKKEEKLDLMMEIERLKELKFQQEKEANRKKQIREGSLIVVDQIKEKDMKRMRDREQTAKEGEMMKRQMRLLLEEDRRNEEKKRLENARLAKEIENINKIASLNKEKKKLAEKELDFQSEINETNIRKLIYVYTLGMQYYNVNEKEEFENYYRNKLNNLLLNESVIKYLDTHEVDLSKKVDLNIFSKDKLTVSNNKKEEKEKKEEEILL